MNEYVFTLLAMVLGIGLLWSFVLFLYALDWFQRRRRRRAGKRDRKFTRVMKQRLAEQMQRWEQEQRG